MVSREPGSNVDHVWEVHAGERREVTGAARAQHHAVGDSWLQIARREFAAQLDPHAEAGKLVGVPAQDAWVLGVLVQAGGERELAADLAAAFDDLDAEAVFGECAGRFKAGGPGANDEYGRRLGCSRRGPQLVFAAPPRFDPARDTIAGAPLVYSQG
jgi:hypothetical protein